MIEALFRLGLIASLVAPLATPAFADPVDDVVQRYRTASHIPGAAVAVIRDGKVTKLAGYGEANVEWGGAATPDTPFQIASASKIFAGVVLMRLVEQGAIRLDAPVSTYLPDAPATWSAITVRHLAGHMSGLPEGLGLPTNATPAEVAAEAMKRPLAYAPGSQSRYGLTDFVVMTAILEKVTGLSYPELLRREVTTPLKLSHTGFTMLREGGPVRSGELMLGRVQVYGWRDGRLLDEAFLYPVNTYAAGGLYSSARDIATLMVALEEGHFLKADSLALLTTPARLDDGKPGAFGVGWTFGHYRGEATVGHTGGPALADVMYVPSKRLTIITLTNQRRFYPVLSQSIADLILPAPPPQPAIADTRPALTDSLRKVFDQSSRGAVEAGPFTAAGQKDALPFYRDFGRAMLEAAGPLKTVELLSDQVSEGRTRRLYRVSFERRQIFFVTRSDEAGLFDEIRPLSGDPE